MVRYCVVGFEYGQWSWISRMEVQGTEGWIREWAR